MAEPEKPKPKSKASSATRYGNGRGWGGPPKGASDSEAKPITTTERAKEVRRAIGSPLAIRNAEEKAATTAILHGVMFDIATNANEAAVARTGAAVALDNRLNGTPVARVEHSGGMTVSSLSDEALMAIIAAGGVATT